MSTLVVLRQWFGEINGSQVEKPSFQIFLEGPEVAKRRGEQVTSVFIGFVGKNPGEPINYQPVIDAFRDLLPAIELQIRTGLVQWRADLIAAAEKLVAEAEQLVASAKDAISVAHANDALAAAKSNLVTLTEQSQIEQKFARSSDPPSPEQIQQFLESIRQPASQAAETGMDLEADQQNL